MYLIAQHGSPFNLDVRPVKAGPTEIFSTKTWKTEFHYLNGEKSAEARRLVPSEEIGGGLPVQLSRWTC